MRARGMKVLQIWFSRFGVGAQSMRARGMKETTLPTVGRARPGAVHAGAGNESAWRICSVHNLGGAVHAGAGNERISVGKGGFVQAGVVHAGAGNERCD